MQELKIAIVDDEQVWISKVEEQINACLENIGVVIKCYVSGEEFLAAQEEFAVVFMDIEMPGLDGFSVLEQYRKTYQKTICIILTTHIELSRHGYKVEAFRYIDKHCLEEIDEALKSALLRLERYQLVDIPVKSMGNIQILACSIQYFEVYGHDVFMYMADGEKVKCNETISQLSQRLEEKGFVMTGRSYLVNLVHMKKVETNNVFLNSGKSLPLSKRKYIEIRKMYFEWKLKRANG